MLFFVLRSPLIRRRHLGIAYKKSVRYQEVIEPFKQAIKLKPDLAEAHHNLELTYLNIESKGSALKKYEVLKTLDPERANKFFDLINK